VTEGVETEGVHPVAVEVDDAKEVDVAVGVDVAVVGGVDVATGCSRLVQTHWGDRRARDASTQQFQILRHWSATA